MKVPPTEVIGERIKLRPVREDDLSDVHEYASDPEVCEHMVWGPNSLEETKQHMQEIMDRYAAGEAKDVDWSVERLEDGVFLGKCSLHGQEDDSVQIGYVLSKKYWGQGYGTELTQLLIRAGKEDYGFNKVIAICNPNNIASGKILEKAGMKSLGVNTGQEMRDGEVRESEVFEST